MKILLTAINAKYIHSNLAVYSLKAAAGEYQDTVEIAEFTINNQTDYILEEIYKRKPDVLMFSCYIWNIAIVEKVITEFNKLCPKVPIWVGGPEVSYEVEYFLFEHPEVIGIMMGEGEETFRELCQYYAEKFHYENVAKDTAEKSKDRYETHASVVSVRNQNLKGEWKVWKQQKEDGLKNIKGIAYIIRMEDGDEVHVNPWRKPLNMGKLPFCYDKMEDFSNRIIYYESSRGCPFSCSYCLSSIDKKLRFRDLKLVKKELQFFIDQKVPQVKFVDRTFNCNHAHAMAIWQYILEHDNGVTNFHFEISADLINEEELALMEKMRPGLIQLEIGVQSTNEVTIREINRTMNLERVKEVVEKIRGFGNIHQHLDLIVGLPYEDYDTFGKSFNEIYILQPNQLQMGFLKVLKGSYMYEHAHEYEVIYHDSAPYEVLSTRWLPYDDIIRMKRIEEMLEVYYNSGQFEMTMKVLGTCFDSAFDLFQKLGDYYENKRLFGMSHSRMKRCEILMGFLKKEWADAEDAEKRMDCIREALIFDLYYRENCKSRPAWAQDMGTFKQMTHYYCKNGKMSHVEPFHYDFLNGDYVYKEEVLWALFSYDKRDPLTHQADVRYVEENVWQQNEP